MYCHWISEWIWIDGAMFAARVVMHSYTNAIWFPTKRYTAVWVLTTAVVLRFRHETCFDVTGTGFSRTYCFLKSTIGTTWFNLLTSVGYFRDSFLLSVVVVMKVLVMSSHLLRLKSVNHGFFLKYAFKKMRKMACSCIDTSFR